MPNFAHLHDRINAAVQAHISNAVLTFENVPVDVVFRAEDNLMETPSAKGRMQQAPRQWLAKAPAIAFTAGVPARGDLVDIDGESWRVSVAEVSLSGMAELIIGKASA
jgi:hypothetical protein